MPKKVSEANIRFKERSLITVYSTDSIPAKELCGGFKDINDAQEWVINYMLGDMDAQEVEIKQTVVIEKKRE